MLHQAVLQGVYSSLRGLIQPRCYCGIFRSVMALNPGQTAVAVRDVHKWYRIYASPTERIKRVFGARSRHLDVQALDHINLEVAPGTALGIIGENGAGKSTLMKIIAGTTSPTMGSVEVNGTVAAILELGAAFHPEFSGRGQRGALRRPDGPRS